MRHMGVPQGGRRTLDSRGHPVRRLTLFFCLKKANFREKITAKVSGQSELRISIYTRNGETEPGENAETERQIQSRRGSRPSQAMGAKDQRGNPSPIQGGGQGRRRRRGALSPSLPVAPECHRGPSSSPQSSPTTSPPSSPTLPPFMQRCNLSLTRCNLYLNMVLNAIYYFPMMYGYPMMFEQIRFVLWVN